jgi:hypothetical protein
LFVDPRSSSAVATAEQYADGLVDKVVLKEARRQASQVWKVVPKGAQLERQAARAAARAAEIVAMQDKRNCFPAAFNATQALKLAGQISDYREEERVQLVLLRDVIGNPFRPASVDPVWLAWNNGTVPRLARAIYEERAFTTERMGILANALEEAGCTDPTLLNHCRSGNAHVRGCWLVDLLSTRGPP